MVIVPNNIQGTPGKLQHDTHFSGATKALHFIFGAVEYFVANIRTGESDTTNMTKYAPIKEAFVEKSLSVRI